MTTMRLHNTGAASSKATTQNPKDLLGNKKVSITKLPAVAMLHGASAMMDGAEKYGPYNWRDKAVIASIYVDAAMRHLLDWFEGQELAKDSGVHHLGHAIACCAIILDAQHTKSLVDDRPGKNGNENFLDEILDSLSLEIVARRARQADNKAKEAKALEALKPSCFSYGDSVNLKSVPVGDMPGIIIEVREDSVLVRWPGGNPNGIWHPITNIRLGA